MVVDTPGRGWGGMNFSDIVTLVNNSSSGSSSTACLTAVMASTSLVEMTQCRGFTVEKC